MSDSSPWSGLWPADLVALVPVYNHASRIGAVIRELRAAGAPVWVVDDGSSDGSGAVARAAGATVLTHAVNRGKGCALRSGFAVCAAAGYARVLTVDADGQHPPAAWARLLAAAPQVTGIVIGRRDMTVAPSASCFGRRFSNYWCWIACGVDPGDSQSGLRIYPLSLVERLGARGRRYHFEVQILVRAVWAGLSLHCVDVPVRYGPERITHFRAVGDNIRASLAFTGLVLRRLLPWPHRRLIRHEGMAASD